MTPEQKQIAIAEFEGYSRKECPAGEIEWRGPPPKLQYIGRFSPETVPSNLPSYLTSRDAICGAVARLDSHQGAQFVSNLAQVQGWTYEHVSTFSDSIFSLITATPAQMADALLLTLGYEP